MLRPNEGHESSADANTEEGIKIDQAVDKPVRPFLITSATAVLDEAHREHLWNQIELATFPIDLEIWKAAKEVRRIAFHTLEVALAVTNRRIADGLGDHSSMKPVAKLTEKRLKRQNKKLQWKMGAAPLVFDNHPLFFAVKVSAAKIHMYARRLEYLRARLTGESFPTPLRSDNFHPQLQYKLQVFDPPMSIPKRKPGQMVAWYQEVKHKKIKDNYGPKMTWYHLEVARDGEAQGNQGEGEERRQVMRRHTSRSAWEKNNLYFYNKHNKKVSFQRQKPLKNSPIASPRPAESPVATASHARPQTSPVATSIIRNLPVKSNIEYRRLESTGAAAPKIRKFSIEGPLNIRRLGKPDFPRTPGLIREFHSSTQVSFPSSVPKSCRADS